MATNPILTKGLEIAQFYYGAQRYFSAFIRAAEGVATHLTNLGLMITSENYGRPVYVEHWAWSRHQEAHLPKFYMVLFNEGTAPPDQEMDRYGFCLWFFTSDPTGGQSWVPTGFFFRATPRPGGTFEHWVVVPKIADAVRTQLVHPDPSAAFLSYAAPWPSALAGNGVDQQLQSIDVVPFPLACITTSEDLEAITQKAIKALLARDPDIRTDAEYLQRFWGLEVLSN
jgi:hypothetical protein